MPLTTLLIDLDDTVYPVESGVWQVIRRRIFLYVAEKFQVPQDEARQRCHELFLRYGTTLRGLQVEHHIDEEEYLAFVHNVPLADLLKPDPSLRQALSALPQRKLIFTNADAAHAQRVLAVLELEGIFEAIIDIKRMAPYCKPMPEAFAIALRAAGVTDPTSCLLADDQPHNVRAARALGIYAVQVGAAEPDPQANASVARLADLACVIGMAQP